MDILRYEVIHQHILERGPLSFRRGSTPSS